MDVVILLYSYLAAFTLTYYSHVIRLETSINKEYPFSNENSYVYECITTFVVIIS